MCVYLFTGVYMFHYVLICLFCMCVIVDSSRISMYLCRLRQRRQGIVNCAFIRLCTAPFTFPHREDDGVELASQCLADLHAVCVLLVSKGIELRDHVLCHH